MHETDFLYYLKDLKKNFPEVLHQKKNTPIIFIENKTYVPSLEELINIIFKTLKQSQFGYNFERFQGNLQEHYLIQTQLKLKEYFEEQKGKFVYFDIQCKNIENQDEYQEQVPQSLQNFRLIIELYNKVTPKTCENFLQLCCGYRKNNDTNQVLTYQNTNFTRVQKDYYIQGGNVNGKGGESIYGQFFADENTTIQHDQPGILGMTRYQDQRDTNGSQFYITLNELQEFDKQFVAFGQVIYGFKYLKKINKLQPKNINYPVFDMKIVNSGMYFYEIKDFCGDVKISNQSIYYKNWSQLTQNQSNIQNIPTQTLNNISINVDDCVSQIMVPELKMEKNQTQIQQNQPVNNTNNQQKRNSILMQQQQIQKQFNLQKQVIQQNNNNSHINNQKRSISLQNNHSNLNQQSFYLTNLNLDSLVKDKQKQSMVIKNSIFSSSNNQGLSQLSLKIPNLIQFEHNKRKFTDKIPNNHNNYISSHMSKVTNNIIQHSQLSSACDMKVTEDSLFNNWMMNPEIRESTMDRELKHVLPNMGESIEYSKSPLHPHYQQKLNNIDMSFPQLRMQDQSQQIQKKDQAVIEYSVCESFGITGESQQASLKNLNIQQDTSQQIHLHNINEEQNQNTLAFKQLNISNFSDENSGRTTGTGSNKSRFY